VGRQEHAGGNGEATEARHHPQQVRSQETWAAIIEAAAALFAERGYEHTTTHQIAARAGVSVGALYRYFANKEALVIELYRRYISELRVRILEEFPAARIAEVSGFRDMIHTTLSLAFRLYAEHPGLRRVLVDQSRKIPELIALRHEQEAEVRQVVRQILGTVPAVQLPDPEVGAYLVHLFIESLIDDVLLYGPGAETADFDEARLLDAGTDFILRYLTGTV